MPPFMPPSLPGGGIPAPPALSTQAALLAAAYQQQNGTHQKKDEHRNGDDQVLCVVYSILEVSILCSLPPSLPPSLDYLDCSCSCIIGYLDFPLLTKCKQCSYMIPLFFFFVKVFFIVGHSDKNFMYCSYGNKNFHSLLVCLCRVERHQSVPLIDLDPPRPSTMEQGQRDAEMTTVMERRATVSSRWWSMMTPQNPPRRPVAPRQTRMTDTTNRLNERGRQHQAQ